MEFIILCFEVLLKLVNTVQFWLKLYRDNKHFTWRPTCVSLYLEHNLLNIYQSAECFKQKLYKIEAHLLWLINHFHNCYN